MTYDASHELASANLDHHALSFFVGYLGGRLDVGYLGGRLDDKGRVTKKDWEAALSAAEASQRQRQAALR